MVEKRGTAPPATGTRPMPWGRSWLALGLLLPIIALLIWAVTTDKAPPETASSPEPVGSPTVSSSGPMASAINEPIPRTVEGGPVGATAVYEVPDGTLTLEVVGYADETTYLFPEVVDDHGSYFTTRYDHTNRSSQDVPTVWQSADGVDWVALPPVPGAFGPWRLIAASEGVVLVSYDVGVLPVERWRYWRWRGDAWAPLKGLPADAGDAISSFLRISTEEEFFVTSVDGPFLKLSGKTFGCLGVRGVASTEFGLAVNMETQCDVFPPENYELNLIGSGSGAVAVLVDGQGVVSWRSPPGVEATFQQLLAFALSEGSDHVAEPNPFLALGGEQRFWTSTDGLTFELASVLPASPRAAAPAVFQGTVVALELDITVAGSPGASLIVAPSSLRVLMSEDARTWIDSDLEIELPIGEPLGPMAAVATDQRVLVTVSGRTAVGAPGEWVDLDDVERWDDFHGAGDHFLALDWSRSGILFLGISREGSHWDVFDTTQLVEALSCGTGIRAVRFVGGQAWLVAGDDQRPCIIRGRFEPIP